MATKGHILCGVCEVQDVTTVAEHWCPECDEGLCSSCLKYHTASKSSRNHDVISVDNYSKLPPSITSIKQHCPDHDKKFQNYCPQHESLCCPICISTVHRKCEVLAIDNIIKASKESSLLEQIETAIGNIKFNIDSVIQDREENLETIKKQRQKFQEEVKEIRGKINRHLDDLEQQVFQEMEKNEDNVATEIKKLLSKLSKHHDAVIVLQNTLSVMKNYASDLQTFLGSKKIESDLFKEEQFLQELRENGSLQRMHLILKHNDKLSNMLHTITTFGAVSTETTSPSVIIFKENEKEAQSMSMQLAKPKSIDDINLVNIKKLILPKGNKTSYFTGCCFTSSGKMVFIDYDNSCLIVLNDNGIFDFAMCLPFRPVDITCIDDKTVAISHSSPSNEIKIVDITTKQIVKIILKTSNQCCGISYCGKNLIYYEEGTGIKTVPVSGGRSYSLVKQTSNGFWNYITASREKIYQTCLQSNTIICFTMTGQKIWEYKDSVLARPCGIATDSEGNIYVASRTNDSIVILSPDGKYARTILTKESGLRSIFGIHLHEERKLLLVANQCESALICNLR